MKITLQEELENIDEMIFQYMNHCISVSKMILEFIEKRKILIEKIKNE